MEGAFVQGMGYYVIEELVHGDPAHPWVRPGEMFTKGPGKLEKKKMIFQFYKGLATLTSNLKLLTK